MTPCRKYVYVVAMRRLAGGPPSCPLDPHPTCSSITAGYVGSRVAVKGGIGGLG